MRRLGITAATLAVLATLLGGCGDDEPPPAAAPRIDAAIERSRLFETQRQLKLILRNDTPELIVLDRLELRSSLFERVAPQERRTVLHPGQRSSIPIDFGPSRCEGDPSADALEVEVSMGGEEVVLALEESTAGALAELRADECETARIRSAADLRLGPELEEVGPGEVRTTLTLERTAATGTVVLDEVRGSVIFTLLPDEVEAPLLTVDDSTGRATAEVVIRAARCDPHALIESKRTFVFVGWVQLDDGPTIRVDIEPDGPVRATLEGFLESCLAAAP